MHWPIIIVYPVAQNVLLNVFQTLGGEHLVASEHRVVRHPGPVVLPLHTLEVHQPGGDSR